MWYTMWTVRIVVSLCNVRHMWRTMQVEPDTGVPYRAHDAVKVLKTNRNYIPFEMCIAVSTVKFIHKLILLNKLQSYNLHLAPRQKDILGIQLQNCRIDSFCSSIQHRGAMIWNSLDPPIRKIKSLLDFKIMAKMFLLEKYTLNSASSCCS